MQTQDATPDRREDEWMWHYPSTDGWAQRLDPEPVMHADVPCEQWEVR